MTQDTQNQKKNKKKFWGILCGILAAVCYGTNPLGAVNLYNEGMTTNCVLFYRFGLAWLIIALVMLFRKESVKVSGRELKTLVGLGVLFAISSLSLYVSFHHMDVGVASTILFVYPVMTAAIMVLFFKERLTWNTFFSLILSLVGVVLLYWSGGEGGLSTLGVILVLVSALSYALYIIVMDKSRLVMSSFKINFYVVLCCALAMLLYSWIGGYPLTLPHSGKSWFYVCWLAVVPAIMALVLMVYAAKWVGSTTTAILGALEPLTAVLIGLLVFEEAFSWNLAAGIVLILSSVCLIALKK